MTRSYPGGLGGTWPSEKEARSDLQIQYPERSLRVTALLKLKRTNYQIRFKHTQKQSHAPSSQDKDTRWNTVHIDALHTDNTLRWHSLWLIPVDSAKPCMCIGILTWRTQRYNGALVKPRCTIKSRIFLNEPFGLAILLILASFHIMRCGNMFIQVSIYQVLVRNSKEIKAPL